MVTAHSEFQWKRTKLLSVIFICLLEWNIAHPNKNQNICTKTEKEQLNHMLEEIFGELNMCQISEFP